MSRRGNSAPLIIGGLCMLFLGVIIGLVIGGGLPGETGGGDADDDQAGSSGETPRTTPAEEDDDLADEASRAAAAGGGDEVASLGAPPIEFDPPLFDFGRMSPGDVQSGSVDIVNVSDQPLLITETRATCTCTSINLSNSVLEQGERISLVATFDARQNLGPKRAGVFVMIDGYDPVRVALEAEVALAVRTRPTYISAYDDLTGTVTVESLDGEPFSILSWHGDEPEFVDFDPRQDPLQAAYELRWDIRDYDATTCLDSRGRRLPAYFYIETDHPDCPLVDVMVRSECTKPDILTNPRPWYLSEARFLLGELDPGTPREFTFSMRWLRNALPNDIARSVTTSSDAIELELVSAERQGNEIEVTFRMTPNEGYQGIFYAECTVNAARDSAPFLIIGKVVGDEA